MKFFGFMMIARQGRNCLTRYMYFSAAGMFATGKETEIRTRP
jgi:hypothetical protein